MSAGRAFLALSIAAVLFLAGIGWVAWRLGVPHTAAGEVWAVRAADACGGRVWLAVETAAAHRPVWRETVLTWLLAAMASAGVVAAARTAWATRALVRRLARHRVPPDAALAEAIAAAGLGGRVEVCREDALFCFCYGWLRPRVCLSTGLAAALGPEALHAVLLHERHHVRRRDPLKTAVAGILAAAAFPLPLVAALRRAYLVTREIEADRAAVALAGRSALARALYTLLTHPRTLPLSAGIAVGAIDAAAGHGDRIDHLLRPAVAAYPRVTARPIALTMLSLLAWAGLIGPAWNSPAHDLAICPAVTSHWSPPHGATGPR